MNVIHEYEQFYFRVLGELACDKGVIDKYLSLALKILKLNTTINAIGFFSFWLFYEGSLWKPRVIDIKSMYLIEHRISMLRVMKSQLYRSFISRNETETIIRKNATTNIIRLSTTIPGCMVVSFYHCFEYHHVIFSCCHGCYISSGRLFKSINEIIESIITQG